MEAEQKRLSQFAVFIDPKDNVVTAFRDVTPGRYLLDYSAEQRGVDILETIKSGFKVSIRAIRKGEHVLKYGFPIGHMLMDIEAGTCVHVTNMASNV